jgi:NifU-like protein involved in Fe-S cluster formation
MRLTYLDLSVSALKKCNANPHHRSTIEEKHCVAQQPPSMGSVVEYKLNLLRVSDASHAP